MSKAQIIKSINMVTEKIIDDLNSRKGFDFDYLDEEILKEIKAKITSFIYDEFYRMETAWRKRLAKYE